MITDYGKTLTRVNFYPQSEPNLFIKDVFASKKKSLKPRIDTLANIVLANVFTYELAKQLFLDELPANQDQEIAE